MNGCAICGTPLKDDLFAAVTGEKCCAICKVKFIGGLPTSNEVPNRADFILDVPTAAYAPLEGQVVEIRLGSSNTAHALFTGIILSTEAIFAQQEGGLDRVSYAVHAIDWTWGLTKTLI